MADLYVIVALFNFGDFPVFNELVGVKNNSRDAFRALEDYDCKKVIASKYEMKIDEVARPLKEFGIRAEKLFYEETHKFKYQIDGDEEAYPVTVTLSIFQA